MGKKTRNQRKAASLAEQAAQDAFSGVPHTLVFSRGTPSRTLTQLVTDTRRVMQPYTASSLKVGRKNVLKDFVTVSGPLGITHFMIFSKTLDGINLKLARIPNGPTITFKVNEYCLHRDVVSSIKRHRMHEEQFTTPPLLVCNNLSREHTHLKLTGAMLQNMFPSINVHKVRLNTIKRCVLFHYDPDTKLMDFRHYNLRVVPVGMSKGVKKLLQERFPNMSRFSDISDLLLRGGNLSESEAEVDGDHNITELPQSLSGRGNMAAQQSAVRLTEIGPRMTLQLIKIEEGLCEGKVLFHEFEHKSEDELAKMLRRREAKLLLKDERRRRQEDDVMRKVDERERNRLRSLAGMKRKLSQVQEADSDAEDPCSSGKTGGGGGGGVEEEDDEAEFYRQAVGEEPDADLFPAKRRKTSHERTPNRGHDRSARGRAGGRGGTGGGVKRGGSFGSGRGGSADRGLARRGRGSMQGERGRGQRPAGGRGGRGGGGRGGRGSGRGSDGGRGGRGSRGGRGRGSDGGRGGRGGGSPGRGSSRDRGGAGARFRTPEARNERLRNSRPKAAKGSGGRGRKFK
ncbi:suppressor of SWI4 1 homolog [Lethenteron reissneri]|uniref:suppressor of SWI4 1 homolog n=1 Tax=Lethenteron reissneri TaxID=7753 RepID=UPI002AB683FB|nr:suppressor of SWI4 1 homolog [Lethenteron reissneri]XP_061418451.1 suppressor of SWI4 1 homolog [Lethenteron reissneri]